MVLPWDTCWVQPMSQQFSFNLSPKAAQGFQRALLKDEICQKSFSLGGKNDCRCVIPKHTSTLFMSKHLFCAVKDDNTYSIHVISCSLSAWPWLLTCCEPQSVPVIQGQFLRLRRRERCYGSFLPFFFLPPAQLVMYPLFLAPLHVYFTPFRLDKCRMSRHFHSCTTNTRQLLFSAVPFLLQEHTHA